MILVVGATGLVGTIALRGQRKRLADDPLGVVRCFSIKSGLQIRGLLVSRRRTAT